MPVTTSSAPAVPSQITNIASGSGTYTGDSSIQDLGNFSVGALGNKMLIIEMWGEKTLGTASVSLGWANAAGGTALSGTTLGPAALADINYRKLIFTASQETTTECVLTYYESHQADTTHTGKTSASATFDFSATETLYLVTTNRANTEACKYRWVAYVVDVYS